MKHVHAVRNVSRLNTQKFFHPQQLSEQDVIYLHDIFLTSGMHDIHVTTVEQGRSLLRILLQSLNYFQSVSVLTVNDNPLEIIATNMYDELMLDNRIDRDSIDHYFAECFYADFLWIEATYDLIHTPWFAHIEQKLTTFISTASIPIIKLSYLTTQSE